MSDWSTMTPGEILAHVESMALALVPYADPPHTLMVPAERLDQIRAALASATDPRLQSITVQPVQPVQRQNRAERRRAGSNRRHP